MVRKRMWFGIIIVSVIFIMGCASFSTVNTDRWIAFELPPSRINYTGDTIMTGRLSDGTTFYVFYDSSIDDDARFYYHLLMQSFGWRHDGHGWVGPQSARDIKRGHIYINPRRQVGIYFFPQGEYEAFKVRFDN